jgi:hypothetical protein
MGLDMYLYKRTYVKQWDHEKPEEQYTVTVNKGDKVVKHIKKERVSYVIEEVAYWRKANHIHQWFVNHVQEGQDDCGEYDVSKKDIQKLVDACKLILDKDPGQASILLPRQAGFFFGNTAYDEEYFEDLKETVTMLEPLLTEPGEDFYYRASW